jgi:pSer/pThr/pTyr-binding forkhead associated (FHA) protein/outer membrane biosynthesis protein TonB
LKKNLKAKRWPKDKDKRDVSLTARNERHSRVYKLIGYKDGTVAFDITLDKKKNLVGQFAGADISIDDATVSHYHAFITVDENGGKIIDLDSENGIFLNGERVKSTYFSAGDVIRLGSVEFHMEEFYVEGEVQVEDQDTGLVESLGEDAIMEMPSELPPLPGLVVIDGEYCDIVFDEEHFTPVESPDALKALNIENYYIDPIEINTSLKGENVVETEEKAVEVTILSQGQIITVEYLSLKNQTLFATPLAGGKNRIHIPGLDREEVLPFVEIKNGSINIHPIPGFEARNINSSSNIISGTGPLALAVDDIIDFNYKTVQVMVRLTDAPPSVKRAPFFLHEPEFQKEAGKIVGALMGLMLLLLFIDTTQDVPEKKKIAVIYRKAIKAPTPNKTKTASKTAKTEKDMGVKKNDQPKKPTKMAKKSPNKAKPAKSRPKKMAQKKAPAPRKVAKVKKMKAYEFKMTNTLSSLTSASKSLTNTKVNTNSRSPSAKKGFKSSQASSDSALNSKTAAQVGTLGQDFAGKYDSSSGAKGLASKSGIDTTYTDQKTVVLGSMDPELLRKILREYLPQFRHCYQRELERSEDAKGVVDLNFRIGKAGRVTTVNIKSKKAKFSKSGTSCMAGVLKLIDFPKPKGGGMVDVKQPLNFFAERNKI